MVSHIAVPVPKRQHVRIAALAAALTMTCGVALVTGPSALGASVVAQNGLWSGTTSQNRPVKLTVKNHRLASFATTLKTVPGASGIPASACSLKRVTFSDITVTKHDTTMFIAYATDDADAELSGTITATRQINGSVTLRFGGSTDPCQASVRFTAKPR